MKYLPCEKHKNNELKFVCTHPTCIQTLLYCQECATEQSPHKDHQTFVIPLKNLLAEYQCKINLVDPAHQDYLKQKLKQNKKLAMKHFLCFQAQIKNLIQAYGESIIARYNTIESEIEFNYKIMNCDKIDKWIKKITRKDPIITVPQPPNKKQSAQKQKEEAENQKKKQQQFKQQFKDNIKKIIQKFPYEKSQPHKLNIPDIIYKGDEYKIILSEIDDRINKQIEKLKKLENNTFENITNELLEKFNKTNYQIQTLITETQENNKNFGKLNFAFSPRFKHESIEIIKPNIIRSIDTGPYKVAILQPSLGHLNPTYNNTFYFKINNYSQNRWIGLGICHRDVIISNKYEFVCKKPEENDHGINMISSNTASWSCTNKDSNCVAKAFTFARNDIIKVEVLNSQKKVKFSKFKIDLVNSDISRTNLELRKIDISKLSQEKKENLSKTDLSEVDLSNIILTKSSLKPDEKAVYEMTFDRSSQEKLYACVVFYFMNEEVQLLDIIE